MPTSITSSNIADGMIKAIYNKQQSLTKGPYVDIGVHSNKILIVRRVPNRDQNLRVSGAPSRMPDIGDKEQRKIRKRIFQKKKDHLFNKKQPSKISSWLFTAHLSTANRTYKGNGMGTDPKRPQFNPRQTFTTFYLLILEKRARLKIKMKAKTKSANFRTVKSVRIA